MFYSFAGDEDPHRRQGREEEEAVTGPCFFRHFVRRRVNQRAATVHAVPEGLPSTVMEF